MDGSKLYVMIKPPLEQRAKLRRCRSAQGLDDHYDPARFHCTMLKLGPGEGWAAPALDRLREALAALRFDPFDVLFDEIDGTLLRGRKGLAAPAAFHRLLRRAASNCGVELPAHAFRLHLSLAYQGAARPRTRIDPVGWLAEEFQLVRSRHGHELLGRWPLFRRQGELFA